MENEEVTDGTGNAPESGQAPETQQSTFAVPEGHRLITDADFQGMQRAQQQWQGSKPLVDAAIASGYKTPESFQSIAALSERGVDLDTLSRSFGPGEQTEEAPTQGLTKDEVMQMFSEREAKAEAMRLHRGGEEAQNKGIDALAAELAGEGASEHQIASWKRQIVGQMNSADPLLYPEDSPIANEYRRPYGDEDFGKLRDFFKSEAEKAAASETASVASAASQAAKKPAQTPAGNAGGGGKTRNDPETPETPDERRARLEAKVQARLDKRGGSPVSK